MSSIWSLCHKHVSDYVMFFLMKKKVYREFVDVQCGDYARKVV